MTDFQHILNPSQQKAVESVEGEILVLAGAGSGKTRVITSKIIYILKKKRCFPEEILAITFTNKAAEEMRTRVLRQSGLYLPWICTFHRMGSKILRKSPYYLSSINRNESFTILDNNAQIRVVRNILKKSGLDYKRREEYSPPAIRSMLRTIKSSPHQQENVLKDLEKYSPSFQKVYADIFTQYQNVLEENNCFDFDDLLLVPYQMFRLYPEFYQQWQRKFHFLFVDEFQDTNELQYEMIRMLGKDKLGVTVVGDDDQTIYSWRGAVIKNFVRFREDFPLHTIVKLEENYRSHEKILHLANNITSSISGRFSKNLFTSRKDGEYPVIVQLCDEKEEGKFVAERILTLQEERKIPLHDIAVFCRTNWQFRNIEDCLRRYNIPYQVIGNIKFYDRREIRILLDYMQFLVNPENLVILRQIINIPSRYIGERTWEDFLSHIAENAISTSEFCKQKAPDEGYLKKVHSFIQSLYYLHEKSLKEAPSKILDELLALIDYKTYIIQRVAQSRLDEDTRWENVEKFIGDMRAKEDSSPDLLLHGVVEELSLLTDADEIENNDMANLMTIHCAKGLEFSTVIITGMEEGILPHHRTMGEEAAYEEEKRLLYVAMTRAKDLLYMTFVKKRWLFGTATYMIPSEFISLLSRDGLVEFSSFSEFQQLYAIRNHFQTEQETKSKDFKEGEEVVHMVYGKGIIQTRGKRYITVRFENQGVKEIDPDFVHLRTTGNSKV